MAKSDQLRRRPEQVRYFYLAISPTDIHTGASYAGLKYVMDKHGIDNLYVADLTTGKVGKIGPKFFSKWWKENYNDPDADLWKVVEDIKKEKRARG